MRKATYIDYENYEKGKMRKTEGDKRKIVPKDRRLIEERRKTHLETFPYICDNCKKFTHAEYKYCQYCGVQGKIRVSKNSDYDETYQAQLQQVKKPSEQKIKEKKPVLVKIPPEKTEPSKPVIKQEEKIPIEKIVKPSLSQIKPSKPQHDQTQPIRPPPKQIVKVPVSPVKPKRKKEIVPKKITPPKPKINECPFCGIHIDIKEQEVFCQQCGYILKK